MAQQTKKKKKASSEERLARLIAADARAAENRKAKEDALLQDPKFQEAMRIKAYLDDPHSYDSVPQELIDRTEDLVQTALLNRDWPNPALDPWSGCVMDYPIRMYPSEILRQRQMSNQLEPYGIFSIISQMRTVLEKVPGIGLAAPQASFDVPCVAIRIGGAFVYIVNPVLTYDTSSPICEEIEGCLSLPYLKARVPRYACVTVTGLRYAGPGNLIPDTWELTGWEARIAQHEIDHLNGILFIDRCIPNSVYWDSVTS